MRKLQTQGVHHITIVGADRRTSIDFWEGVLGMPFVFEQPNLDNPSESHLYFDPGDGRLITIFTNDERAPDPERTPTDPGCVHHIAFSISQATFAQTVERLDERGIEHSGTGEVVAVLRDDLPMAGELQSPRQEQALGDVEAGVVSPGDGKIEVARGEELLRCEEGALGLFEERRALAHAAAATSIRSSA